MTSVSLQNKHYCPQDKVPSSKEKSRNSGSGNSLSKLGNQTVGNATNITVGTKENSEMNSLKATQAFFKSGKVQAFPSGHKKNKTQFIDPS